MPSGTRATASPIRRLMVRCPASGTSPCPQTGPGPPSSTSLRNCGAMDELSEAEAANRLMRLGKQIAKHDQLYHDQDAPEISDADYDALVREHRALEERFPHLVRSDSPSQ